MLGEWVSGDDEGYNSRRNGLKTHLFIGKMRSTPGNKRRQTSKSLGNPTWSVGSRRADQVPTYREQRVGFGELLKQTDTPCKLKKRAVSGAIHPPSARLGSRIDNAASAVSQVPIPAETLTRSRNAPMLTLPASVSVSRTYVRRC